MKPMICLLLLALVALPAAANDDLPDNTQAAAIQIDSVVASTTLPAQPSASGADSGGPGGLPIATIDSQPGWSPPEWLVRVGFMIFGAVLGYLVKWMLAEKAVKDAGRIAANAKRGEMSVQARSKAFTNVTKAYSSLFRDSTEGTLQFMLGQEEWRLKNALLLPQEFDDCWMEIISRLRKIDRLEKLNARPGVSDSVSLQRIDEMEEHHGQVESCFELARGSLEKKFGKHK